VTEQKPGKHRKIGEDLVVVSDETRRRIIARDGKTKEIPTDPKEDNE